MEYFNLEISAKVQLYFQIIKNCLHFDAKSRTFACVFCSMHAFSSLEMAEEAVLVEYNHFGDIE